MLISTKRAALLLSVLAAAACGAEKSPEPPAQAPAKEPAKPSAEAPAEAPKPDDPKPIVTATETSVEKAEATVTEIDAAARRVTIRRDDGEPFTIHAGEAVRNFDQVKVGDRVKVEYQESLAIEVHKPGEIEQGASAGLTVARAEEGEKPAGTIGRVQKVTATIVAIDKENLRVTLRRPDGKIAIVRAKDPEKVAKVSVGDVVEITYTEAVAISVSDAAAK